MWRLGDRKLPGGIRLDGGSDWIALSYDFCRYINFENNSLLRGLDSLYNYTLLPAEACLLLRDNHNNSLIAFHSAVLLPHRSTKQSLL